MNVQTRVRREGSHDLPVLVWKFPVPMRAVASAPHGGGIGVRRWVVNAQVPPSYRRRDPDHHLRKLAVSLGLPGRGVGMLTTAHVRQAHGGFDGGVDVLATVGLAHPILAAAPDTARAAALAAGTINIVAMLPEKLTDAALVNAVATVTEAKTQALRDAGFNATGTPTDAVCILCPDEGRMATFGGPRSTWGARLARAVHAAVLAGARQG